MPERSRFNRRRRNPTFAINLLRQLVLRHLDLAECGLLVIDSWLLLVVGFHLAPGDTGDWGKQEVSYGCCASKKQIIYGYKLHLLMTLSGVIVDFSLAPANESDLAVGAEMMHELCQRTVIGDKGYV
ncbi:MAG: hypothetical protein DLM69_10655 [Candidatus Chloroheliales bacterium]|nr:MAG: hypothetical protein DLM69_10655 [Chloroflexota bacterium]